MNSEDSDAEMSDRNPQEDVQSNEEDTKEDERVKIREELSNMTFEELQKLKNKIGSKKYDKIAFGGGKVVKTKESFKRANKNRPREISSKIRSKSKINLKTTSVSAYRDPRFDPLCGNYDEQTFKDNYKFVNDVRKKERKQLEKNFENAKDEKEKKKIKYLMQRIDNQMREEEKRQKEKEKKREEMYEIKEKLKRGEKPTFKKKSDRKIESLVEKYEDLKRTSSLQKHIEKRSKKLDRKERKNQHLIFDT